MLDFGCRFAAYKAIAMGGPAPSNTTTTSSTDTAANPIRSSPVGGGGSLGPGSVDPLASADPTAVSPTLRASALPTTATRAAYVHFARCGSRLLIFVVLFSSAGSMLSVSGILSVVILGVWIFIV